MKVFQIINSYGTDRGGAELLVRKLHLALLNRNINCELLAIELEDDSSMPNAAHFGARSPYSIPAMGRLRQYLRSKCQSDVIIHGHLFPVSALVASLGGVNKCPAARVFTEHSTFNRRRNNPITRWFDRRIYDRFDRIFAVSQGVGDALSSDYPSVKKKTRIVPNGIDLRAQTIVPSTQSDLIRIVSVGRLKAVKNIDSALRAIAQLDTSEIRYDIVGSGPEEASLRELTQKLGLSDCVTFHGHVADVYPFLDMADIFLMPSHWEGFGLAAVEAMSAHLAVVVSDVAGVRDILGNGELAGLLVNPNDIDSIVLALRKLVSDADLRQLLGQRAHQKSLEYSFEHTVTATLKQYEEILSETQAGCNDRIR